VWYLDAQQLYEGKGFPAHHLVCFFCNTYKESNDVQYIVQFLWLSMDTIPISKAGNLFSLVDQAIESHYDSVSKRGDVVDR